MGAEVCFLSILGQGQSSDQPPSTSWRHITLRSFDPSQLSAGFSVEAERRSLLVSIASV